ncbi:MAG: OmpA family protein [Myxococcales bacterium]|nr:OmpA family protein [Myxococcales bacterium]
MSNAQQSSKYPTLRVVAGLALLASAPAAAQDPVGTGYSIDIEFLRPTFGHDSFVGVDVPRGYRDLTVRAGTVLQYQSSPLTLYEAVTREELGAVVTNRFSAMIGASLDINRVTFGVMVPTALNWGTEQASFGADGFGLGDIGANVRLIVVDTPRDVINVGVRGGVILPTGRQQAYMAEQNLRLTAGGLLALNLGNTLTLATDFGVMTRSTAETSEDFDATNEITWGNAARLKLPDATRTAINGQVLARAGLQDFLQGGAENALEALVGLEFYPSRRATFGISAGRGLTEGYGTTDLRLLGNLVFEIAPPEDPPPIYTSDAPPPPTPDAPPPPVIVEEPVFEEGELAVQIQDRIYIKDKIEFFVNTANLKPESQSILTAVADIINGNPQIGHLIIEGHASQEGAFDKNYTLAESRARRIWEEFLKRGVASERISYRGKGEVEPIEGEVGQDDLTEEALQTNRRVEFLIIKQLEIDEIVEYPDTQYLPWSGETVQVVKPVVEVEEEDEIEVDEFGIPIDDDEFDIGDDQ